MGAVVTKCDVACAGCGVLIERGDLAITRAGTVAHPGCEPLGQRAMPINASVAPGFLFAMGDEQQPAPRVLAGASSVDVTSGGNVDVRHFAGQFARVFDLMRDGQPRSLEQIAEATGMLETSASARLRDCRKREFGSHEVVSQIASDGVRMYRVITNRAGFNDEQQSAA